MTGPRRALRTALAFGVALLITGPSAVAGTPLSTGPAAAGAGVPAGRAMTYTSPVAGPLRVVRGFDPPATRYGPGHLGVDLRVPAGGAIRAAGNGIVSFAGAVAGRGVVVITHPDGVLTEYEPLRPLVRRGVAVARGQPIGTVRGAHPGCAGRCLHWGARRAGVYLNPLSLLRPLGVVRLLPWRGAVP